jgi:hypothetical protein
MERYLADMEALPGNASIQIAPENSRSSFVTLELRTQSLGEITVFHLSETLACESKEKHG